MADGARKGSVVLGNVLKFGLRRVGDSLRESSLLLFKKTDGGKKWSLAERVTYSFTSARKATTCGRRPAPRGTAHSRGGTAAPPPTAPAPRTAPASRTPPARAATGTDPA